MLIMKAVKAKKVLLDNQDKVYPSFIEAFFNFITQNNPSETWISEQYSYDRLSFR